MNPLDQAPFIIADIGSNHRNDFDLALRQIDAAAECGVSAVKFQLFTYRELYGLEGRCEYELPREWIPTLASHCTDRKVHFMCTAFSPEGIDFIDPYVQVHKLASSEFSHPLMREKLFLKGKPTIFSTGGATHEEVRELVQIYPVFCRQPYALLECVGAYPAAPEDYALNAMKNFEASDAWSGSTYIGISDHTGGRTLALAAAGAGATIFETHFDSEPWQGETPDSAVCLDTITLRLYCERIRQAFSALGDGIKLPRESERAMVTKHKRRLKIIKRVHIGDTLVLGDNFGIYRSVVEDLEASPPNQWKQFEGKRAARELSPGDGLKKEDVEG